MGRRVTKAWPSAQLIENQLQFSASGDDDASIDCPQIKQEAEIVEVPIEERVFVVPFDFERHPILVAVYLVRWSSELGLVHHNAGIEWLLDPAELYEVRIEFPRYEPL